MIQSNSEEFDLIQLNSEEFDLIQLNSEESIMPNSTEEYKLLDNLNQTKLSNNILDDMVQILKTYLGHWTWIIPMSVFAIVGLINYFCSRKLNGSKYMEKRFLLEVRRDSASTIDSYQSVDEVNLK